MTTRATEIGTFELIKQMPTIALVSTLFNLKDMESWYRQSDCNATADDYQLTINAFEQELETRNRSEVEESEAWVAQKTIDQIRIA